METDRSVLSRIKEILKDNPRGLNVKEIAAEIDMNRQSVAKYLEMLVVSGHVDVRAFGPSKVYYLSQRLPVSAMLSLSYGFIIVLDKNASIINVNDNFLEFAGVKREDLMYKNIEKFAFPIEFEPSIMPNVMDAIGGTESSAEAFYRKKGKESYYNVRFIPMVMDDGEKGVAIFFEDITARKSIENRIIESEFKFRSIIEQTQNGILLIDERGYIVEFNRAAEKILGLKRDDVIGKAIWDTWLNDLHAQVDPRVTANWKAHIQSYLKTGTSRVDRRSMEQMVQCADGVARAVQVTMFSIKTNKGFMLCCVYIDVTARKLAETELKKSEERYKALVESVTDGIWEMDKDLRTSYVSGHIETVLGYKPQEVIGVLCFDLVAPGDVDRLRKMVYSCIKSKSPFTFVKCSLKHKDGRPVPIEISGSPIFDENGEFQGFICTAR